VATDVDALDRAGVRPHGAHDGRPSASVRLVHYGLELLGRAVAVTGRDEVRAGLEELDGQLTRFLRRFDGVVVAPWYAGVAPLASGRRARDRSERNEEAWTADQTCVDRVAFGQACIAPTPAPDGRGHAPDEVGL